MARLSREMIITEKIDGTNAQIFIVNEKLEEEEVGYFVGRGFGSRLDFDSNIIASFNGYTIRAGSRNRWITPKDDNYGLAKWIERNHEELISKLGEGRHYGEWWGQGIQRGYNMKEKVFSLFNVARWGDPEARPSCCRVVPVLNEGPFSTERAQEVLDNLAYTGSIASPGFMKPEGIIVWHVAGNFGLKKTIERDEGPKSLAK